MNAPVGPLRPPRMDWVWRQRVVETFMGRRGDVCLGVGDIIWAGGAPIFAPVFLGAPSVQCNPPLDADDTRLATTWFVRHLIEELAPTQGPPGPQGPPGLGINILGSVPTAADLPPSAAAPGDAWFADDTGVLWVWDGTQWVAMAGGPQGPAGAPGSPGPQGPPGPQGQPGTGFDVKGSVTDPSQLPPTGNTNGDVYIDESTGKGYVWDGSEWVIFDLGAEGPQGPPGPPGATGAEGPPGQDGADGGQGPIGPPGATGPQGPQGAPGTPGGGGTVSGLTGDVSGSGSGTISTTVVGLRGRTLGTATPVNGQYLMWNGSQWVPSTIAASGVTSVNGRTGAVTLTSADITNAGGALATQLGNYVLKTGDSMSGGLTVTQRAGTVAQFGGGLKVTATGANSWSGSFSGSSADIQLSKASATFLNQIAGLTSGSYRWQILLGSGAAESGGNVGSPLTFARFPDSGGTSALGLPLQMSRPSGLCTFEIAISQPSSRAIKERITPIPSALDKVMRLQGCCYALRNDPRHKMTMGLIGEDVEPVCPEVIEYMEPDGAVFKEPRLTIQYTGLIPLLIEAIKELARRKQ